MGDEVPTTRGHLIKDANGKRLHILPTLLTLWENY